MKIRVWLKAFRLRTLPLALATIAMGSFLAAAEGAFDGTIFFLCALTTFFLQILSNLANDYGDSVHGADNINRLGPKRTVQTGEISPRQMKNAMYLFGLASLISGVLLLYKGIAFSSAGTFGFFFLLGIMAIAAAIRYTNGSKPYGYSGLGDISVFIFFGIIGVMGTYYLHVKNIHSLILLPAISSGCFAVGVLNINNIRDIESDRFAGKQSIPVRIGGRNARIYHWFLLFTGITTSVLFVINTYKSPLQFLYLISVPLFIINGMKVQKNYDPQSLDPMLKQMALSSLVFTLLFGISQLLA